MVRSIDVQRIRRRTQRSVLGYLAATGVVLFLIYTVLVVGSGTLVLYSQLSAVNRIRRNAVMPNVQLGLDEALREDEIVQVLGGPDPESDDFSLAKAEGPVETRHRVVPFEIGISRLFRTRRLLQVLDDAYYADDEAESGSNVGCPRVFNASTVAPEHGNVFPSDLFTVSQRRHGAIIFHFCGLVYMFVALAIVCDEYFVPALGVITETLQISDDVAGATFMAAGGSAPEFFTSLFGVFLTENNVGASTIVGSATFNILCVLAFCTLFSGKILHLTWWPLCRDMIFYVFALLLLLTFFYDERIEWHEAVAMLTIYFIYGIFMKYNTVLEMFVKYRVLNRPPMHATSSTLSEGDIRKQTLKELAVHAENVGPKPVPILHSGAMYRAGIFHVALDPMFFLEDHTTQGRSSPIRRESVPVIKVKNKRPYSKAPSFPILVHDGRRRTTVGPGPPNAFSTKVDLPQIHLKCLTPIERSTDDTRSLCRTGNGNGSSSTNGTSANSTSSQASMEQNPLAAEAQKLPEGSEVEEPIDMAWPQTFYKQCVYVAVAPIMYPLYCTLPDVKKPERKKYAIFTFIGSVLWIAFFSYLMIWWAHTIGLTLGISTEVMGLTILAAGTSIPDLITSVIVARKGLGDMAVSSSIGSNLFDICIGLPVPWLLRFIISSFGSSAVLPVSVVSNGLICSLGLLFLMLLVLLISVIVTKWQMNKIFGLIMLVAYVGFCITSILLEVRWIECPLRPLRVC